MKKRVFLVLQNGKEIEYYNIDNIPRVGETIEIVKPMHGRKRKYIEAFMVKRVRHLCIQNSTTNFENYSIQIDLDAPTCPH